MEEGKKSKTKKKGWKWFWYSLASLLLLIIILILLAPTILSSGLLLNIINNKIPGKITAKDLSLGWFISQSVTGLTVLDPNGQKVISVDQASTSASLLHLLFSPSNLETTKISGVNCYIKTYANGSNNLFNALVSNTTSSIGSSQKYSSTSSASGEDITVKLPFTGNFFLENCNIELITPHTLPVYLQNIQAELVASDLENPVKLHIQAVTKQDTLTGKIDILGETNAFDDGGKLILKAENEGYALSKQGSFFRFNSNVTNFPVSAIDQLMTLSAPSFNGVITQAIGYSFNTSFDLQANKNGSNLLFELKSENVNASIDGGTKKGEFTLAKTSQIDWEITPNFIEALSSSFNKESKVTTSKSSNLSFQISRMQLPFSFKKIEFAKLALNLDLKLSPLFLQGTAPYGQLQINGFEAVIDTFELGKNLTVHLKGNAKQNGQPFDINLDAQILNLFSKQGHYNFNLLEQSFIFSVNNFPTELIPMPNSKLVNTALGPFINVNCQGKGTKKFSDIDFSLKSNNFTIEKTPLILSDFKKITLKRSSHISYMLTQALISDLSNGSVSLKENALINCFLQRLVLPTQIENNSSALENGALTATIESSPLTFFMDKGTTLNLQEFLIKINADKLSDLSIDGVSKMSFSGNDNSVNEIFGDTGDLSVLIQNLNVVNLKDSTAKINLKLESPQISSDMIASLEGLKALNIKKLVFPKFVINPALLNHYLEKDSSFFVKEISPFNIQFEEIYLPLDSLSFQKLKFEGEINTDKLIIENKVSHELSNLNNIDLRFSIDAPDNELDVQLQMAPFSQTDSASGSIDSQIEITSFIAENKLDLTSTLIKANINGKKIPSSFFNPFTSSSADWSSLLGSSININLDVKIKDILEPTGSTTLAIDSQNLQVNGELDLSNIITTTRGPIYATLDITPKGFDFIQKLLNPELKEELLALDEHSQVKITFSHFQMPSPLYSTNNQDAFSDYGIAMTSQIDQLKITNRKSKVTSNFENMYFKLDSMNLAKEMTFLSSLNVTCEDVKGSLKINSNFKKAFTRDGSFNKENISGESTLKADNIPSLAINNFFTIFKGAAFDSTALLGKASNMNALIQLDSGKGPINWELNSENLTSSLDLYLNQGDLTLTKDMEAKVKLTKKLSEELLDHVNPILVTAVGSKNPITYSIEKEGFFIPVSPFDLKSILVSEATLDLGIIEMKNGGVLGLLVTFLKMGDLKNLTGMSVWFTPMNMHMKNGISYCDRMDFLVAETIHCATWGTIDFVTEEVNMILGISAETLQNSFGISGLSENYMLQIPMTGKLDDVKMNWALATTQIGSLIAGEHTGIIGSQISQLFNALITEGDKVPPPNRPFPWEKAGIVPQRQQHYKQNTREAQPTNCCAYYQQQEDQIKDTKDPVNDFFKKIFGEK